MKQDPGEENEILSCRCENGKEEQVGRSLWVGRLEVHSEMDENGRIPAV